jgi:hypothetical protein
MLLHHFGHLDVWWNMNVMMVLAVKELKVDPNPLLHQVNLTCDADYDRAVVVGSGCLNWIPMLVHLVIAPYDVDHEADGDLGFRVLGVEPNATSAEIKAAFRQKALEVHPDVNNDPDAEERFKLLARAYGNIPNCRRLGSATLGPAARVHLCGNWGQIGKMVSA